MVVIIIRPDCTVSHHLRDRRWSDTEVREHRRDAVCRPHGLRPRRESIVVRWPCCWRWRRTRRWPTTCACGSPGAAGRTACGRERSPSATARSRSRSRWASRPTSRARCGSTAMPDGGQKLVDPAAQPARLRRRRRAGRRARRRRSCSCSSRRPTIPRRPAAIEVPLADLSGEFVNKELDNRGNRLLVMRTPGDSLRVRLARDSLVFAPGETFKFTLEPHALPLAEGGRARIKVQLLGSGGKELWSQQHDVQAGHDGEDPAGNRPAQRGGRLRRRDRGREQSELVAGGPPAVELEADDRRAAGATAGARPAAAAGVAGRSRVHPGGRDRSGQSAVVREAQQAAAVAVDQGPAAAAVERAAGQRLPANAAAPAGRSGRS